MESKYWDDLFENYDSEILDVFKNDKRGIVKSWITEVASPNKSVADIGCAIGKWLPLLSSKFKEVLAVDFSQNFLNYSESTYSHLSNVSYRYADMTRKQKFSNSFDVLLCVNAIMMTENAKREIFIKNLHINLKRKGQLVLVVPSYESALYSDFIFEQCKEKSRKSSPKKDEKMNKNDFSNFRNGIVKLNTISTKHYLKEELIFVLNKIGFRVDKMDKVEYSWRTEIENYPKWLKAPFPWDWVVMATKK